MSLAAQLPDGIILSCVFRAILRRPMMLRFFNLLWYSSEIISSLQSIPPNLGPATIQTKLLSTHHFPPLPLSLLHPFPFPFPEPVPSAVPTSNSNSLLTCAKDGALSPISENSSRTIPSPRDFRCLSAALRFSAIPFPTGVIAGGGRVVDAAVCVSVTVFVTNDTPRPGGGCLRLKLFPAGGSPGGAAGMSRMSRTSFAVGMATCIQVWYLEER